MKYRHLQDKEIASLLVYGCSADDWKELLVADDFSVSFIQNVHFSGKVCLGTFNKVIDLPGGVRKHSGIYNCHLHNCTIGNNVYINKVNNYIANYDIDEDVYIENVNSIITSGESSFGNGTEVAVMIESGERTIPVFDKLSAPMAYMMTFYRHDTELTEALLQSAKKYIETTKSDKGSIGKNAHITNCGSILNVRIGNCARLDGAVLLEQGTIISTADAPIHIGNGVQCNEFIIGSGSAVTDGAMLTRCFIGQGCIIGKQFSAIDSVFFANCQGQHGEAISVFAGPYTVTHHKSTLMLTALYSFMNAGSGSNFSNHMYKLGPVHQGITERGVKTSSNSYIMWPAHIGAFSIVLGRHKGNPDLKNLPFSYLIEADNESHLLVGINLHSAGTIRDVQKWPKRDLRSGEKTDPVHFDFLSPYTLSKVLKGIDLLKNILANMDSDATFVWYQNCKIKRSALRKGIELYEMAVDNFIAKHVREITDGQANTGSGNWVDMAGLLAPQTEIEKLCQRIIAEKLSVEQIQQELLKIYDNYPAYKLGFVNSIIQNKLSKTATQLSDKEINDIVNKGEKAELAFNDLILRDAKKEFSTMAKTGFGIDGDDNVRNADFDATRGVFDDHPFVIAIKKK
ncbi:MAG: hypothetical protein H6Q20_640 [Bacteroidetes bacterium]|nr:hypothetical protein [Bacteroidota bacterium]